MGRYLVYQEKYDRLKRFLIYHLGEIEGVKRTSYLMRRNNKKTLIFKYGIDEGTRRYNQRIQNDRIKGTLVGYINRYGEELGPIKYYEKNKRLSVGYNSLKAKGLSDDDIKRIKENHSKKSSGSLNNLIEKHGLEAGTNRYHKNQKNKISHRSWKDVQRFFNCNEDEAKEFVAEQQKRDLTFYIKKYGEVDGRLKYENANRKRGYANTKEYYIEKYGEVEGITKYKQRVQDVSKSSRIEHYIEKYGEVIGPEKFKELNHRKGKFRRLETFIEKYGEELGTLKYKELNQITGRRNTLEYYIERYGEIEGNEKFKQRMINRFEKQSNNSNIQIEFSTKLYELLNEECQKNYHGVPINSGFILHINKRYNYPGNIICPDIRIKNIIIEFDGEYWHSKEETRIRDAQKDIVYGILGYTIIRIPEQKYKNNKQETLIGCINDINKYINKESNHED